MFVASPKGLSSQILMANWRSFVLGTSLAEAMAAGTLMAREEALGRAYQLLGERFNALSRLLPGYLTAAFP